VSQTYIEKQLPDADEDVDLALDLTGGDVSKKQKRGRKDKQPADKKRIYKNTNKIRRRKRRKGWIFVVLLILAAAGYFIYTNYFSAEDTAVEVRFTEINRADLMDAISVKGNVQSVLKRNVYSNLAMTVKSVEVSVGDRVSAGQALCRLDRQDLELNIEQSNAELNAAIQNSDKQIESSEKILSDAADNLESGTNAQILNAEAALRNAAVSLETAQTNYNNLLKDYNNGTGASRKSAESAIVSAQKDLDARTRDLENNTLLFEAGAISKETLTQSETLFENAQIRYDDALTNLENAKVAEERALDQARNTLRSAQTAHGNAQVALETAQKAAQQELSRYEGNVETARVSANIEARKIAIKKLEKQLADSVVTSPVDGVVTAVYAKEGGSGAGMLFIVEDPEHLVISIKIKEYDAGKLFPGMPVKIKSDAIPGVEYNGTLTKIDPAAVKNAMGETDTMSDIEFGAEVSVDSSDTLLRIGMNTRLDIIIERRDQVFSVPYDSIATNEANEPVVYVIEEPEENMMVARQIPVEIGLETDFYVEISSPELTGGMRVINEAADSTLADGAAVALQGGGARRGTGFAARFGR